MILGRSVDRSVRRSVGRSIGRSVRRSVGRSVDRLGARSVGPRSPPGLLGGGRLSPQFDKKEIIILSTVSAKPGSPQSSEA